MKAELYKAPLHQEECPKLLLTLPSHLDSDTLVMALEAATKLDSQDFGLEMLSDRSALLTFHKVVPEQGRFITMLSRTAVFIVLYVSSE